jgi:RimJ/RimL family protein N-acetyltransferase
MFDLQPTFLHNDLVSLSPLEDSDFDQLFAVASDPMIWEQHPNPDRYKEEVFRNFFKGAMESKGAFLIKNEHQQVIGCTRFYDHHPAKREVKIGYTFFSRACWGKPYNRSTKALMLQYAFQFVDDVIFHVGANNVRSQKAMEKMGGIPMGEEVVAYYGEEPKVNIVYKISKS